MTTTTPSLADIWTPEAEAQHQRLLAIVGPLKWCPFFFWDESKCVLEPGHELPHEDTRRRQSW